MDLGFEGNFAVHKPSVNAGMHGDWIQKDLPGDKALLRKTSFKTIFANDINVYAKRLWDTYFGGHGYQGDVYRLGSVVDIVKNSDRRLFGLRGAVDVLTGGFPCQDFSVAGKRKGFSSHRGHDGKYMADGAPDSSRGNLYLWMKRVIEIVRPKAFIAENVKGMLSMPKAIETITGDFGAMADGGYLVVKPKLLNACEHGVPQTRERVLFVGFLKSALTKTALRELSSGAVAAGLDPFPAKTHCPPVGPGLLPKAADAGGLLPAVPSGAVLLDLDEPEAATDESQRHHSRARFLPGPSQGQTEVRLDKPAPTIRSEHHGNIEFRRLSLAHGGQNASELARGLPERRLTIRECARLQTFPDDYRFVIRSKDGGVSASEAYRVIGNAVPPLLAYAIARNLEDKWDSYF
jgi:DNA (cytosine-5)-methyltransferase 1